MMSPVAGALLKLCVHDVTGAQGTERRLLLEVLDLS